MADPNSEYVDDPDCLTYRLTSIVGDPVVDAVRNELLVPFDDPARMGPVRWVYFYQRKDGTLPADEFLNRLKPPKLKAKFAALVSTLLGTKDVPFKFFHRMKGNLKELYELKNVASGTRVFALTDHEGILVLLCGITGKFEDDLTDAQVSEAVKLFKEYHERRRTIEVRLGKGPR